MFWSGETLLARLPGLSADFRPESVDCNAWTLTVGKKIYITPTAAAAKSGSHTIRNLNDGESFQIPPGQFAFLQTAECVRVPASAMAFISMKASIKLKGLINVSGFHVDPGFDGVLIFTVYNAGPSPIHLHQGQSCFLIWFASLDNELTKYKKNSPSNWQVDGNSVGSIAGQQQTFDDISTRLHEAEKRIEFIQSIGKFAIGAIVSIAIGFVLIQLRRDTTLPTAALLPSNQHNVDHAAANAPQVQFPSAQTQPSAGRSVLVLPGATPP